jgi:hypothetical protein
MLITIGLLGTVVQANSRAASAIHGVAPVLVSLAGTADSKLLGIWDGRRWQSAPAAHGHLRGRIFYRSQGLSGPARKATGDAVVSYRDGPCSALFGVTLFPLDQLSESQIATRADLITRPRAVNVLPLYNPEAEQAVRAELQRRGLRSPVVQLRRVVRADLDGDGSQELIIEATHFAVSGASEPEVETQVRAGDSSLLLIAAGGPGRTRTTVLGAYVARDTRAGAVPVPGQRYQLIGVADLNGDGQMDLVTLKSASYQGYALQAFTWTPARGVAEVLKISCNL